MRDPLLRLYAVELDEQGGLEYSTEAFLTDTKKYMALRVEVCNALLLDSLSGEGLDDWPEADFSSDPSLKVKATVSNLENGCEVRVSVGMFLAIQDVACRMASPLTFMGPLGRVGGPFGEAFDPGCHVVFPRQKPRERYIDYGLAGLDAVSMIVEGGTVEKQVQPSNYLQYLPSDMVRLEYAEAQRDLAFNWVMLHEYSHFYLGHFEGSKSGSIERLKLFDEFCAFPGQEGLSRFRELTADEHAAKTLFFMYWDHFDEMFEGVHPPNLSADRNAWKLRFFLTSVAISLLVCDFARKSFGHPSHYPSLAARLWLVFRSMIQMHSVATFGRILDFRETNSDPEYNYMTLVAHQIKGVYQDVILFSQFAANDLGQDFAEDSLMSDGLAGIDFTPTILMFDAFGLSAALFGADERDRSAALAVVQREIEAIEGAPVRSRTDFVSRESKERVLRTMCEIDDIFAPSGYGHLRD